MSSKEINEFDTDEDFTVEEAENSQTPVEMNEVSLNNRRIRVSQPVKEEDQIRVHIDAFWAALKLWLE